MSIVLDGSQGVTFPNGTNPQAAPSKVLQVVSVTSTTLFSTLSTSYVDVTNLSATITPLFSTSKILILWNVNGVNCAQGSNATNEGSIQITDGSNNLITGIMDSALQNYSTNSFLNYAGSYLASPATTSAITYKIRAKSTNASYGISVMDYQNNAYNLSGLTLMEIAQ